MIAILVQHASTGEYSLGSVIFIDPARRSVSIDQLIWFETSSKLIEPHALDAVLAIVRATESVAAVTVRVAQDSSAVILAESTDLRFVLVFVVFADKLLMDSFKCTGVKDGKWIFLKVYDHSFPLISLIVSFLLLLQVSLIFSF